MARKKKIGFIMDTNWIIQPPIDTEYKQYVLLSYFQKMNEKLDNLEVYPSFIELSLHFASLQTLIKENKLVVTEKKFETVDDEVLMTDLVFKDIPPMSEEDTDEFKNILKYSAPKMFDYFNIAKSIWQIAYDSASVSIKKNKSELTNDNGFFYYNDKFNNKFYVWEYKFKKPNKRKNEVKQYINLIYSDVKTNLTITEIIENFSNWNKSENLYKLPIFEVFSSEPYPLEHTLLPIFKRKILSYISQTINVESYKKIAQ
jgi:hypothetical protein